MLHMYMDLDDADRWRKALEKFMKWYGINQNEWCRRSGVPYSTLNGFMIGKNNNITWGTLEKLAGAVNVSVSVIMGQVPLPGMRDSGQSGYESAHGITGRARMISPEDEELLDATKNLTPAQKKMLSRMSKALPDDGNGDKGQDKIRKKGKR